MKMKTKSICRLCVLKYINILTKQKHAQKLGQVKLILPVL